MKPLRWLYPPILLMAAAAIASAQCTPGSKNCPYVPPKKVAPQGSGPSYTFRARSGNPAPWQTVVRIITPLSNNAQDVGSGAIIDGDPEAAIAITAAHVVAHGSPVRLEIFGQDLDRKTGSVGAPIASFLAEVLARDEALDVGLVRFRPGRKLAASPIAPADWKPSSVPLCSVGCSLGADPTALPERFRKLQDLGSPQGNYRGIECERAPQQGRSGGGLYNEMGQVVGVCNFAESSPPGGLYADTESLRVILRRTGFTALADGPPVAPAPPAPPPPAQKTAPTPPPPIISTPWPATPSPELTPIPQTPPIPPVAPPSSSGPAIAVVACSFGLVLMLTLVAVLAMLAIKKRKPAPQAAPQAPPSLQDLVPILMAIVDRDDAEAAAKADRDLKANRDAEAATKLVAMLKGLRDSTPPKA